MTSKMILFRSTVILVLLLFLTFVNSQEFEDSDYKSRGKVEGRPNSRPSNNRPPNNWSSNSQSRPSNSDGQQRPQSGSGSYPQYPLKPNPAPVNHPKPVTAKPVSANKPNSGGSGILGTGIGSGSVISSIVNSGSGSLPNIASITGPNFNPVSGIVRPGHSGNPNTGIVSGVNPLLPIINKPNAGKPWSQSNDGQE
jgi:hypothetical protein